MHKQKDKNTYTDITREKEREKLGFWEGRANRRVGFKRNSQTVAGEEANISGYGKGMID